MTNFLCLKYYDILLSNGLGENDACEYIVEREQEQSKCWKVGNVGKGGVSLYYSYKFSVGLNCFKMKTWGK